MHTCPATTSCTASSAGSPTWSSATRRSRCGSGQRSRSSSVWRSSRPGSTSGSGALSGILFLFPRDGIAAPPGHHAPGARLRPRFPRDERARRRGPRGRADGPNLRPRRRVRRRARGELDATPLRDRVRHHRRRPAHAEGAAGAVRGGASSCRWSPSRLWYLAACRRHRPQLAPVVRAPHHRRLGDHLADRPDDHPRADTRRTTLLLQPSLGSLILAVGFLVVIASSPLARNVTTAFVLGAPVVLTVLVFWATADERVAPRFFSFLLVPLFMLFATGAASILTGVAGRGLDRPESSSWDASSASSVVRLCPARLGHPAHATAGAPRRLRRGFARRTRPAPVYAHVPYPGDLEYHLGRRVIAVYSHDARSRESANRTTTCRATSTRSWLIRPADSSCLSRPGTEHYRFRQYARGARRSTCGSFRRLDDQISRSRGRREASAARGGRRRVRRSRDDPADHALRRASGTASGSTSCTSCALRPRRPGEILAGPESESRAHGDRGCWATSVGRGRVRDGVPALVGRAVRRGRDRRHRVAPLTHRRPVRSAVPLPGRRSPRSCSTSPARRAATRLAFFAMSVLVVAALEAVRDGRTRGRWRCARARRDRNVDASSARHRRSSRPA